MTNRQVSVDCGSTASLDLEEAACDETSLLEASDHVELRSGRGTRRVALSCILLGFVGLVGVLRLSTPRRRPTTYAKHALASKFEVEEIEQDVLNASTGVMHTWQHYWNNLEGNDRFHKLIEKEQAVQSELEDNVRRGVGDVANETREFNKHRMQQRLTHSLRSAWDTAEDLERKTAKYKQQLKQLMKKRVYLNGTVSGSCPDLDGLYIEKVLHSNLGGKGPEGGEPSLTLLSNRSESGVTEERQLAFKVTAITPYTPGWTHMNGVSQGLVGKYGQITIKPGTSVKLKIQTFDAKTGELVHMPTAAFTFFDLDMAENGEQREFLTVGGFDRVELTDHTEVRKVVNPDNTTRFEASTFGTFADNPVDPLLLTEQQKNRAVTVYFSDRDEVTFTLGASAASSAGAWRCFEFVLHPVLQCAKTLHSENEADQGIPLPHLLVAGCLGILIVWCFVWWCCL